MKKHIKKKYLFQHNIAFSDDTSLLSPIKDIFNQEELKRNYNKRNILIQTDNDIYLGFIHNNNGTYLPIALPDFTLVYFDFAYKQNIRRKRIHKDLMEKLSNVETLTEDRSNELYEFYGVSTSLIINLFTSIESFLNQLMDDNCEYVSKKKNRTEVYNREQIQRHLNFSEKIKEVIPQLKEKSFFEKPTQANNRIEQLQELRNMLVHSKADSTFETQIATFKKLLGFKYDETFDAVSILFNFYKSDYIESCPCKSDY